MPEIEISEDEIPAEALDDGPEKKGVRSVKHRVEPIRKCLVTQERKSKSELIRFVLGPDRELIADLKAVLPGRGMWISASGDILQQAAKRGLFAKAARGKVTIPTDLVAQVEILLLKRCCEKLSLANRAGQVVTGFEKVRAALKSEPNAFDGLVLAASDGAEDGKQKVGKLAQALNVEISELFTAEEIGMAFGRDAAIHAFLLPGGLTDGLKTDTARLAGFRKENVKAVGKEEG